jgi:glutamate decarboxylase
VLRVVCRNGFSHDMADLFLGDLRQVTADLSTGREPAGGAARSGFHH